MVAVIDAPIDWLYRDQNHSIKPPIHRNEQTDVRTQRRTDGKMEKRTDALCLHILRLTEECTLEWLAFLHVSRSFCALHGIPTFQRDQAPLSDAINLWPVSIGKIGRRTTTNRRPPPWWEFDGVPPDEFLVSRRWRDINEASVNCCLVSSALCRSPPPLGEGCGGGVWWGAVELVKQQKDDYTHTGTHTDKHAEKQTPRDRWWDMMLAPSRDSPAVGFFFLVLELYFLINLYYLTIAITLWFWGYYD